MWRGKAQSPRSGGLWRRLTGFSRLGVAGRLAGLGLALALAACAAKPGDAPGMAKPSAMAAKSSPFGDFLAGRYAQSEQDGGAAANYFMSALKADPSNTLLLRPTMLLLVSSGRTAEAKPYAERIATANPADPAANLVLGVLALKLGDGTAAAQRFALVPQTSFNALLMPLLEAWAKAGAGPESTKAVQDAVAALKPLQATASFAPFRDLHTALIEDLAGRTQPALIAYQEAMKVTNGDALRVVEAYSNFLARHNERNIAEATYRSYLAKSPDSAVAVRGLAEITAGKPVKPLVGSPAEGAAEALSGVAAVLARQETSDAARIYVQLAIYLRPDLAPARALLADMDEQAQRYEDALKVYRSIDPNSAYGESIQLREAWLLDQLQRRDEAVALLRDLVKKEPKNVDALVALGDLLRSSDKYAEAAEEYSAAIAATAKHDDRMWSLYYARGIAYERSKQWQKAEPDFLEALKLKPDQPMVLNYLGYSWIERGEHVERARHMIERAVAQRPNDGYIVDSLGWALYRMGRYRDAVRQLERAVELVPYDPTINDHLGDAYWRVGRLVEARYQWQRALTFKPDADQVPLIKAKLAKGLNAVNEGKTRRRGS